MYQSPCLGLNYMKFIIPDWTMDIYLLLPEWRPNTEHAAIAATGQWPCSAPSSPSLAGSSPSRLLLWLAALYQPCHCRRKDWCRYPPPLPVTAVLPVAHAPRAQPNSLIFLKWIHKNTPDWQQSARFWKSLKISMSLNPSVTNSLSRCEIYYSRLESGVVNIDYR